MTLPQDVIGVDIAKGWIDVFHASSSKHERIAMTKQSLARFARAAKGCLVICESSGGYERPLTGALAEWGVDYARVNPRQAREFARATGQLAKTDKVDAQILARMGRALDLKPTRPPAPERAHLAELVARRADLVTNIGRETNRLDRAGDIWIIKEIKSLINVLDKQLSAIEARIDAVIKASCALTTANRRLRSVKGIGPVVASVLMARLPELGQMDHRKTASLAGLAPHANDSGLRRGKSRACAAAKD